MAMLLALASSLLWGVADFFGGKSSRGRSTFEVVFISQAAGLLVAAAVAAGSAAFAAPLGYLPWAVGAGLAGAAGVLFFYRALAIGTMGVVAPVAALGVIVPVAIGLGSGVLPSELCLVGIVVAVAGVVTTAGQSGAAARPATHGRSVVLAGCAAVSFGLLQYAISGGSAYSAVMTMFAMRATSVPILAGIVLVGAGARRRPGADRARHRGALLVIAAVGVFDVTANLFFALATVRGQLAVVAVLGSLYPAATVLLARVVDRERLSRLQQAGVVAAVVGVALIAAGS